MPTVFSGVPTADSEFLPRKRWTRAECAELERLGFFEGEQWELIEGELINKMGKNKLHVVALTRLIAWFYRLVGEDRVRGEAPMDVAPGDNAINEPQPDIVVTHDSWVASPRANPHPGDVLLAIEVADSSLRQDLRVKSPLYARAGIPEYWVVDVQARRILVQRDPVDGAYQTHLAFAEGEVVAPLFAEGTGFPVARAFPN